MSATKEVLLQEILAFFQQDRRYDNNWADAIYPDMVILDGTWNLESLAERLVPSHERAK